MKKRTTVFLEPRQKEALERLSQKTGVPVAEIIRRAIDDRLKREKEHGKK